MAKVAERAGTLRGDTLYGECVLSGLEIRETEQDSEEKAEALRYLLDGFFAVVRPADFTEYERKRKMIREEEGVDEVVYYGESADAYKEIKEGLGIDLDEIMDEFYEASENPL